MDTSDIIALIAAITAVVGVVIAWLEYSKRKEKSDRSFSLKKTSNSGNITAIGGDNSGSITNTVINNNDLSKVDYMEEDKRNEWMVYEVAFLWHDYEPPGIEAHFVKMTRKIEETKNMLHQEIGKGELTMSKEYIVPNVGVTRYLTRNALIDYCVRKEYKPKFLFPNERN
ncbi:MULTISPECIES: hypothetical protein [Flavobacteriaceae]|uniref:hypothetical protein n=1 Tax=Flavobacteriaceae TaxID=49546 RepID=UPI001491502A|nr:MULTISPECIES: hypothetical protein [Allomuricauda]MDC6367187.1 hypothetical protein [Muricauda sp. AC10]